MQTDNPKTLLSAREVATTLGCSLTTVWRLAKAGDIPTPFKLGGMTRWRRADIETLIKNAAA